MLSDHNTHIDWLLVVGCHLLPKFLIDHFQIDERTENGSGDQLDLVLIDDDPMCRDIWRLMAEANRKRIQAFCTYEDFLNAKISPATPIYVDKNLESNSSGYDILNDLNERGYFDLHLTTGESGELKDAPAFIRSIHSKQFPVLLRT